jgi:hypothetical protein
MSEKIRLLSNCQADEWDVVCPLCGSVIDKTALPVESYEARCGKCDRWYFKSDAICKPVGADLSPSEVRAGFIRVANNAAKTIQIQDDKTPEKGATREVFNPAIKRMCETLSEGIDGDFENV